MNRESQREILRENESAWFENYNWIEKLTRMDSTDLRWQKKDYWWTCHQ